VYAVATPFLRAIRAQVGPHVLQTADDIAGLCRLLGEHTHHSAPALAEWNAVRAAFSDTSICQHLAAIFERLGLLSVSEPAATQTQDMADVAE
jgi:hypothetical protein